jgi:ADP-ribose pyrophosphatase YjhB (NUDIX family)
MPLRPELAAAPRVPAGDPRLAPDPDLARARALLEAHLPRDAHQARERARMLAFVDAHPRDAHRREQAAGHLTAAALLVDAAGERALLTLHRKLGRWLQLGGHCDGDANLAGAAWREASEESGIAGIALVLQPIDLDVHPIPARPGEPEHLHLDVRFLAVAPPGCVETVSSESHALGWFSPAELERIEVDASVRRLFELVFG